MPAAGAVVMTAQEKAARLLRAALGRGPTSFERRLAVRELGRIEQEEREAFVEELYRHYAGEMAGEEEREDDQSVHLVV